MVCEGQTVSGGGAESRGRLVSGRGVGRVWVRGVNTKEGGWAWA